MAIDQTTVFDEKLQAQIATTAAAAIKPGSTNTLLDFSAFSQSHYTEVVTRGVIEAPIPTKLRDDVIERALRSSDACMDNNSSGSSGIFR